MDARLCRLVILTVTFFSFGASYRTANFVVNAPTPQLAEQIGNAAEKYRRELAVEWLGQPMPNWARPCPIVAQVGDQLGAGGATSFVFEHGEVFGWNMNIQGSQTRILDSVLPHEITHTIFATHFRRPLPRWADEGACTTVEHPAEKNKQQVMLVSFLRSNRGIAFSQMFAMKEYPHDVLPLYSQGYSVARFLLSQGGKNKFLNFLSDGMKDENWNRAVHESYGFADLAVLQNTWLDWVRQGSPAIDRGKQAPAQAMAENDRHSEPDANVIYRGQSQDPPQDAHAARGARPKARPDMALSQSGPQPGPIESVYERAATEGWHTRSKSAAPSDAIALADARGVAQSSATGDLISHQATRPQPTDRSRQVILEWSRPPDAAPLEASARAEADSVYSRPLAQ